MTVGTQLRPHRQLAIHYGVSIMTINKALAGLVSEGVLHSEWGGGLRRGAAAPPDIVAPNPTACLASCLRDMSSPSLVDRARRAAGGDRRRYGLLFSSSSNRATAKKNRSAASASSASKDSSSSR
jgi:DNA-binding transcriptional MocR family regulator